MTPEEAIKVLTNERSANPKEWNKALEMAIRSIEKLNHLTDRPCESCEFHSDKGCRRWKCVFEEVNTDENIHS